MKLLILILLLSSLLAFRNPGTWEGKWKCREGKYDGAVGGGYNSDMDISLELDVIAGDSVLIMTNGKRTLTFSLKHVIHIKTGEESYLVGYQAVEKIKGTPEIRISLAYDEFHRLRFVNLITDTFIYTMKIIHLEKRLV
jgi:hypothetical protein